MTKFTDLGLSEPILRALSSEGYESPTPIQAEFIPEMLAGRDLVGVAQTGTGKTAAFLLPILNGLAAAGGPVEPKCCRALILTPTRELAAQIEQAIRTYGRHVRFSVALVVGGSKPFPQIRALSRGVDIVVATPGRLVDHMESGAIKLNQTKTLVLDEADQMLDLGFLPAVREISAKLNFNRQTVLTSATMPKQIRALIKDLLKDPKHISVAGQAQPIELIDQRVILCNRESKRSLLLDILAAQDMTRGIVFTRTKRGADRVHEHLIKYGLNAKAIHGDKTQGDRTRALEGFRRGKIKILVATDVAARGIDVDDISHVVNYELPNVPEAYVHRIGRTARAGKSGVAISLVDSSEKHYLREIEHLIGTDIPKRGAGHVVELEGDEADAAIVSKPRVKPVKRAFQVQSVARDGDTAKRTQSRPAPRGKPAGAARDGDDFKRRDARPAKPGYTKSGSDKPGTGKSGYAGRDGAARSDARPGSRGKPAAGARDGDEFKRRDTRPTKPAHGGRDGETRSEGRPAQRGKPAGAARDGDNFKRRETRPAKPAYPARDGETRGNARPAAHSKPSGPTRDGGKSKFKGGDRSKGTASKGGEGKIFKPRRPGSRPA
ncbi:DEAD/DEAH box helicase [uncultured Maricaulis sp.]|uniref:DEAD/DEAH box helicase n=1 Tax=uncultured Maricaulis sp. TaxID=174710 RepID=UPI0030DB4BC8